MSRLNVSLIASFIGSVIGCSFTYFLGYNKGYDVSKEDFLPKYVHEVKLDYSGRYESALNDIIIESNSGKKFVFLRHEGKLRKLEDVRKENDMFLKNNIEKVTGGRE